MEDDKADSNATESSHLHFLKQLPKVELHAHLNGCVRETTLFALAKERKIVMNERHFSSQHLEADDLSMYNVRPRSLEDCFEMFAEISKCVDDLAALERITMEALEDFADHYVAYLELRSTPKRLLEKSGGTKMSDKRVYCRTVLDCMRRFQEAETARFEQESSTGSRATMYPRLPLKCRLIVAIDRSQSVEDAYEHVELAIELRNEFGDLIVGVDLCGNPTKVSQHHSCLQGAHRNDSHASSMVM
jgi:adenosine deaminase